MDPCGCYCEPLVADQVRVEATNHVGVPLTAPSSERIEYTGTSFEIQCWDCGPDWLGLFLFYVLLMIIFSPLYLPKIVAAFRKDKSSFRNDRYLSFAAIVSGRHASSELRLKRLRNVVSITRAIWVFSSQRTTLLQCAYCKDPPLRNHAELECPNCGAFHHAVCYLKHGGCSVYGCSPGAARSLSVMEV